MKEDDDVCDDVSKDKCGSDSNVYFALDGH